MTNKWIKIVFKIYIIGDFYITMNNLIILINFDKLKIF